MEHGKIAFCGMNCHVKAKAEFVRQCMEDLENAPMQLVSWVMDGPCRDELLAVCEGSNGKKYIAANWDEEKRAQVYDLTLAGRVSRIYGKLPVGSQFHLRPVLELDGKEIHVESLGFLVFAAAKNERCRLALGTYLEQDEGACAAAFLESEYRDSPLLDWFTWQEEAAARGMLGLLLLMRKEEMGAAELSYGPENSGNRVDKGGRSGENGGKYPRYQAMIQILRRGYARLWTEVKKKPYVSGKIVEERFCEEEDIVTALAQAVVMYVFAEELGIPFQESYSYYVALQIFLLYDGELSLWPEWSKKATKKERGYVKELWRQDPAAGWYYKRHYLGADIHEGYKIQERLKRLGGPRALSTDAGSKEKGDAPGAAGGELSGPGISAGAAAVLGPDGQDDSDRELLEALHGFGTEKFCIAATPVEAMMRHYGLNLRMFRDVRLDRRETELLVTWFGEMEEGEYEDLLLLATVCKYLGQLKSEWEKREMKRLEAVAREAETARKAQEFLRVPEAAGDRTEAAYLANEAGGDGAGIGREVLSGGDGAGTGLGPLSGAGGAGAGREPLLGEAERLQAELKKAGERYAALARGKKNWEKALLEQQRQEKKLRVELESLWEVREREREELASLRNFLFHLKGESGEEKKQERTRRHEAEAVEKLRRERSLVIGGHPGWQKKMRDYLPGSQFLAADSRNFDTSILQNKAYIIFNTDFLLHSSYYRVMAEKKKGQKILYVHGNNPERCLSQLAGQLLPPNV